MEFEPFLVAFNYAKKTDSYASAGKHLIIAQSYAMAHQCVVVRVK